MVSMNNRSMQGLQLISVQIKLILKRTTLLNLNKWGFSSSLSNIHRSSRHIINHNKSAQLEWMNRCSINLNHSTKCIRLVFLLRILTLINQEVLLHHHYLKISSNQCRSLIILRIPVLRYWSNLCLNSTWVQEKEWESRSLNQGTPTEAFWIMEMCILQLDAHLLDSSLQQEIRMEHCQSYFSTMVPWLFLMVKLWAEIFLFHSQKGQYCLTQWFLRVLKSPLLNSRMSFSGKYLF